MRNVSRRVHVVCGIVKNSTAIRSGKVPIDSSSVFSQLSKNGNNEKSFWP